MTSLIRTTPNYRRQAETLLSMIREIALNDLPGQMTGIGFLETANIYVEAVTDGITVAYWFQDTEDMDRWMVTEDLREAIRAFANELEARDERQQSVYA